MCKIMLFDYYAIKWPLSLVMMANMEMRIVKVSPTYCRACSGSSI